MTINNQEIRFEGNGDPTKCEEIMEEYVFQVDPDRCYPKPCSIGSVYQPSIKETKTFYAVSAYLYTLKAIKALDDEDRFSPDGTLQAAKEYCVKVMKTFLSF